MDERYNQNKSILLKIILLLIVITIGVVVFFSFDDPNKKSSNSNINKQSNSVSNLPSNNSSKTSNVNISNTTSNNKTSNSSNSKSNNKKNNKVSNNNNNKSNTTSNNTSNNASNNFHKKSTSSNTNSNQVSNKISNSPSNKTSNKTSNSTKNNSRVLTATFVGDGASVSESKVSCVSYNNSGCTIRTPKIYKAGWNVDGFNTKKLTSAVTVKQNADIKIYDDVTYYAKAHKVLTVTFKFPKDNGKSDVKRNCTIYNNATSCGVKIDFYYTHNGTFENTWSKSSSLNSIDYVYGSNVGVNNNLTLYAAYHHPNWKNSSSLKNWYKDRNLSITKTFTIGKTKFEYEKGVPSTAIDKHISFLKTAYSKTPWIFVPGKVFVLTEETYSKISLAYGLTYGPNYYTFIDVKYDKSLKKVSENATIHELAHAWDNHYSLYFGKRIINTSDISSFYNSLSASERNNLTLIEWFAGASTEYYWHILKNDTSAPSYAGIKNLSTTKKNKFVSLYEKYAKISKNGYK